MDALEIFVGARRNPLMDRDPSKGDNAAIAEIIKQTPIILRFTEH
jgi:hypothetical protein